MDEIDRKIINNLQTGFPVCDNPYQVVAQQLNRMGVIPNHYRLGYCYNAMTVWDIDEKYIDQLGTQIGQLVFVSHCYQCSRHLPDWRYNLFAMLHSKTQVGINQQS